MYDSFATMFLGCGFKYFIFTPWGNDSETIKFWLFFNWVETTKEVPICVHLLFVNCNLICHAISRFLVGTWNSPESGVDSLMHLYICFSYIVDVLMCLSIWLFSCFCCSCLFVCSFILTFVCFCSKCLYLVHQLSHTKTSVYKPKIVLMLPLTSPACCMISAKGWPKPRPRTIAWDDIRCIIFICIYIFWCIIFWSIIFNLYHEMIFDVSYFDCNTDNSSFL